jgi:hypothetical protein
MRYFRTPAAIPARLLRGGPRRVAHLALPVAVALIALLAVPSGGTHSAQAAGAQLTVHAVDFSFQADSTVTAGPVHLSFFNDSKDFTHEVKIFKADQQAQLDKFLAARRAGNDVPETDYFTVAGGVEDVPAGTSIAVDVDLPAGDYIMACFVQSPIAGTDTLHYDLGMHSTLTSGVSGAVSAPVQTTVAAPTAVPAQLHVQAPSTGTGPSNGGTNATWIAAIAAVGRLMLTGGGLVRLASRKR